MADELEAAVPPLEVEYDNITGNFLILMVGLIAIHTELSGDIH